MRKIRERMNRLLRLYPALRWLTTWCSSVSVKSDVRYAYFVTLFGVIVAGISMIYTSVRSLVFARRIRSHGFMNGGNFTASQIGNFTARQFGNFTGTFNGSQRYEYINPYSVFFNYLAIIAAVVAIAGILWLGISLNSRHWL